MTLLFVALGGVIGAALRTMTFITVAMKAKSDFPSATLIVNTVGSFVLGFVAGLAMAGAPGDPWRLLVGEGLCGALTTFSTFSNDSLMLIREQRFGQLAIHVGGGLGLGIAAAIAGWVIGR